jgi:hypothetical protein
MNTESVKDNKKIIQAWSDATHSDDIETLKGGGPSDESQFQG